MKDGIITAFWRLLGVGLIVLAAFRPDLLAFNAFGINIAMSWAGGAGFFLLFFPPNRVAQPLAAFGRVVARMKNRIFNNGGTNAP